MTRHLRIALAALFAVLLLAAGCGDDSGPSAERPSGGDTLTGTADDNGGNGGRGDKPAASGDQATVLAAFNALDPTVSDITFSFDATPDQILAAIEAMDDEPLDAEGRAMASLMANAALNITGTDNAMAMSFIFNNAAAVEMRVIDEILYVRMDGPSMVSLFNQVDTETGMQMEQLLQQAPMFALEDPSLAFMGDFAAGGWISLDTNNPIFADLLDEADTNPAELDQKLAKELNAVIASIIDENTEVTADGQARGGDLYRVKVNAPDMIRALAANPVFAQAMAASGQGFSPGEIEAELNEALADGMPEIWEIEVVVANGNVTSIRMDLAKFREEGDLPAGTTLPVLITFNPAATAPTAPSSHTPIPPAFFDMMGGMMGGMGGF